MTPANFPEANTRFGPPEGLAESQVATIHAYDGRVRGGSLDGERVVVTAWHPSVDELLQLARGQPIFLSFIGGLPPHMVTTDFAKATNPR